MKNSAQKLILPLVVLLVLVAAKTDFGQAPPQEEPPANVAGKWTLYCNDPNGTTSTKYLEIKQDGTTLSGHFKGVYQSGGIEGTVHGNHIFVKTKTRDVTGFHGTVNGNTMKGSFHNRGGEGTFQGERTE